MALPEFIKAQVEKKIGKFWNDGLPEHVKGQIQQTYKIRGDAVTLITKRYAPYHDKWVEMPIAKIKYDSDSSAWFLYMPNRSDKWFNYFEYWKEDKKSKTLDEVIEEIDKDPNGVFGG